MRRIWHFAKSAIGVIFRHPVTGTSVIARLPDGRIVMTQRRDNGLWGLPGWPGYALAAAGLYTALAGVFGYCPACAMIGRKPIDKS